MTPDEFNAQVRELRSKALCSVKEAAPLLDRSYHRALEDIRRTGALCGLEPVRVGERSIRIRTRDLLALLHLEEAGDDVHA